MNGKIDKDGKLHIERAGRMVPQACMFNASDTAPCGHWCPLFGEPEKQETAFPEGCHTTLTICHDVELTFSTFTDERRSDEVSK